MDLLFALKMPGIIQFRGEGGTPNSPKKNFQIFLKIWEGEFECTELMRVECGSMDIFIIHTYLFARPNVASN